jgi:formyltetrahydrofolate synthetase
MIDDNAIAALQRLLSENREARRKIQARLAQIEEERIILRAQLGTINAHVEQTERALRRVLFPNDQQAETPSYRPSFSTAPPSAYDAPMSMPLAETEAEIEAEVAKLEQNEKTSNVRFNDFRIPQAATIVLREAIGPLHVSEIYRRMAAGGFEFRGQHQLITLAVSLSRSKRFRKVAPGTFEINPDYMAGQVA